MNLLEDPISRVKAEAIRTVTLALANVNYVPKNEANIFPDYILPAMNNLTTHNSVVRFYVFSPAFSFLISFPRA